MPTSYMVILVWINHSLHGFSEVDCINGMHTMGSLPFPTLLTSNCMCKQMMQRINSSMKSLLKPDPILVYSNLVTTMLLPTALFAMISCIVHTIYRINYRIFIARKILLTIQYEPNIISNIKDMHITQWGLP